MTHGATLGTHVVTHAVARAGVAPDAGEGEGEGEVFVAGGVESISCVQNVMNQHMLRESRLSRRKPEIYLPMLQTAEPVAQRYGINRER